MIVIISPAKKMNVDTDNLAWKDLPMFLESTEELCSRMQNFLPVCVLISRVPSARLIPGAIAPVGK